ncbi:uncharacterized protein LOC143887378 [Tasmannia lanceolata]|uniref:uncharacterized protein LOC143887378 n=1 Tax=Tasmannia lanceolata TaxID=3420 RepID=UPI004062CF91
MSEKGSKRSKKGKEVETEVLSWREKKALADKEEEVIGKEVDELITWTSMIESMDEQQLKECVLNRPESLQSVRTGKGAPGKRVQRSGKPKCSSASDGLMAAIWKFHREEGEEASM